MSSHDLTFRNGSAGLSGYLAAMVCPVCGYRHGFWDVFKVTNPWKWFCRGCKTHLVVKGWGLPLLLSAILTVAIVAALYDPAQGSESVPSLLLLALVCGFGAEWLVWKAARLEIPPTPEP